MSQKKVVGRRIAIELGIVCVILIAGLIGAVAYYTTVINDKNSGYGSYASDHGHTNSDYNSLANYKSQLETWLAGNITQLQNQINTYVGTRHYDDSYVHQLETWLAGNITELQSQIDILSSQNSNLQNQVDNFNTPRLVKVDLRAEDNRPILQMPRLHVYGYVFNTRSGTAYNCKLHAVAYIGSIEVINSYKTLGTISGESWKSVNEEFLYQGDPGLSRWDVTIEWTNTP